MPDIVLGNGKSLIGIDKNAELRDLYFPFVGLKKQVLSPHGLESHGDDHGHQEETAAETR
jgi:hypothetical protein